MYIVCVQMTNDICNSLTLSVAKLWKFKLRLTDFSGTLLDNKLKPLSIVGVA